MPLPVHIAYARELRKNQTPEEKLVWEQVRARRLQGFKFLRQHPIIIGGFRNKRDFYIADFYCAEKRLIIELDEAMHKFNIAYDKARDAALKEMRLTVIRFHNAEVTGDLNGVLKKIIGYLQ